MLGDQVWPPAECLHGITPILAMLLSRLLPAALETGLGTGRFEARLCARRGISVAFFRGSLDA